MLKILSFLYAERSLKLVAVLGFDKTEIGVADTGLPNFLISFCFYFDSLYLSLLAYYWAFFS